MESSMLGAQAEAMTPALASAAVVGACVPPGMAAVRLPGTAAPARARLRAVVDASKPRRRGTSVLLGRQDTPQHNVQKFVYIQGIAATNGAATGPHREWDPV